MEQTLQVWIHILEGAVTVMTSGVAGVAVAAGIGVLKLDLGPPEQVAPPI